MSRLTHSEIHMVHRIGWLRAAVLGANDGLVSTARCPNTAAVTAAPRRIWDRSVVEEGYQPQDRLRPDGPAGCSAHAEPAALPALPT